MNRLSVPARLAICLACLTISVVLCAETLGLLPDDYTVALSGRGKLCESLAIYCSQRASLGDIDSIESTLLAIKERNPEILSIAIRRADGHVVAGIGDHSLYWLPLVDGRSTEAQFFIPILDQAGVWGSLEIAYQPIAKNGWWSSHTGRLCQLVLFVVSCCALVNYIYLRKVLRELNPQKVIPSRVKMALDTMAEGLVILDAEGRIMLSNASFARVITASPEELLGKNLADFPWTANGSASSVDHLPWQQTLDKAIPCVGESIHLAATESAFLTFHVNASPISDHAGRQRGVLISFDDITQLERKKAELHDTVKNLRVASEEVHRQNQELERLATRDPLTACFNRRSFFERFNACWESAKKNDQPLSCVMVDVDHFKSINDKHGHSVGDQVLQKVGKTLQDIARERDVVCRYGGEEFAVLLPQTGIAEAAVVAEQFRVGLERAQFPNLSVTASLGVSAINLGAGDPQVLLDQADKCLYVAKRSGRNQVVRWDRTRESRVFAEEAKPISKRLESDGKTLIPFQAVKALISTLAYRDVATAEHSRRVADLCVAAGEGLMSLSACYVLENAALLHDIGKLGVPDSILLKSGSLTHDEWKILRQQERIGVEIIQASFDCPELVSILVNHPAWYCGMPNAPHLPKGEEIPLGARILHIANAYDSMTSYPIYRETLTREEAFAELRAWAGKQFDPGLVEHFIKTVQAHSPRPELRGPVVSQAVALQIGMQIERLLMAVENQDIAGLKAMGSRLHATAQKHQIPEIAIKAAELTANSDDRTLTDSVLETANELIELCRSTQSSSLRIPDGNSSP